MKGEEQMAAQLYSAFQTVPLILMIGDEDVDKSAHAAPDNCADGSAADQGDGGVHVQSGIYRQRNRSSERTASQEEKYTGPHWALLSQT